MNGFRIIGMVLLIMASIRLPATAQAPKTGQSSRKTKQKTVVLFVCEHGAVKSVIAAAHFNRLARERHLAMRAVARGTYPEAEIPSNVVSGLRADGLAPGGKPKKLAEQDVVGGRRVVAFCKLPEEYGKKAAVEHWDDVPSVSEDYQKARDAIVNHIKRLLDELQAK